MTGSTDQGPSALKTSIWLARHAPGALMRAMGDSLDQHLQKFPTAHGFVRVVRAAKRDVARLII